MDIRSVCWISLVVLLFRTSCSASQSGNNSTATVKTPGNQTSAEASNNKTTQQGNTSSGVKASSATAKTELGTTKKVDQCVKGSCTAKGDDESCLRTLNGKCPSTGSCTKNIQKNATHTIVTVGCGLSTCPKTTTATTTAGVKPSTTAPSTTTYICCEAHLCNQYQPKSSAIKPKSSAFRLQTDMYVVAMILLIVCM